ncbi:uncharacterized protein LOC110035583 [Phalaenopsis equestris]|uniref:uncharacterized protein LOC110035583 n=1 Tax=Phalaenopsis equestris TaxID=78828 RepID=UPI0009E4B210|nr:uncharacterized protein LOC110035583 [Phalaenopsis equestris]
MVLTTGLAFAQFKLLKAPIELLSDFKICGLYMLNLLRKLLRYGGLMERLIPGIICKKLQKKVEAHLKKWNWDTIGIIHENLINTQSKVINMEKIFQRGLNSEVDLHKANEELLMQINYSESFLKQKAAFLFDAEAIAQDAVHYFQNLFNDQSSSRAQINIELFSDCQEYVHNLELNNIPLEGEIKAALDSIDDHKVAGPDGFTAMFCKATWNIIHEEFVAAVQSFFKGIDPPRYFTASTINFIPKNSNRVGSGDFRPISLTNVTSKVSVR